MKWCGLEYPTQESTPTSSNYKINKNMKKEKYIYKLVINKSNRSFFVFALSFHHRFVQLHQQGYTRGIYIS